MHHQLPDELPQSALSPAGHSRPIVDEHSLDHVYGRIGSSNSRNNLFELLCLGSNVLNYSYSDLLTSVLPVYRKLLKEYPKLKLNVFSGDVDAIVPYWGIY